MRESPLEHINKRWLAAKTAFQLNLLATLPQNLALVFKMIDLLGLKYCGNDQDTKDNMYVLGEIGINHHAKK